MKDKTRTKILHITPHLGAGVGTVVLNYLSKVAKDKNFEHSIICLDYANDLAIKTSKKHGFLLKDNLYKNHELIKTMVQESEIVLVHWWNHPLLYDFLIRNELPQSRVILWSHAAGYPPPITISTKILKYPDKFILTTPLSYKVEEVRNLPIQYRKNIFDIWSTGGLDRIKNLKLKKHHGFNIGYIGTVDYTKMHPDFLDICDQVNIPGVKFIIVGGPNSALLEKEAEKRGIGHKFKFTGFVSEKEKWQYLSTFDIFGYPLAPHHYGTCDQVLQESMSVGVPPVVLANPMESYMVKNKKVGLVAKSKKDYVKALEELYKNKKLRTKLSKNTREYALKIFSLENMINEWNKAFVEILKKPKTIKKWSPNKNLKNITGADIFLESLGRYSRPFDKFREAKSKKARIAAEKEIKKLALSENWRSKNKCTVHQFNTLLPNDPMLSYWSKLMS